MRREVHYELGTRLENEEFMELQPVDLITTGTYKLTITPRNQDLQDRAAMIGIWHASIYEHRKCWKLVMLFNAYWLDSMRETLDDVTMYLETQCAPSGYGKGYILPTEEEEW